MPTNCQNLAVLGQLRTGQAIALFDLDGTLVDTEEAILSAYRAAGLVEPDMSRPWREWCDPAVHARKVAAYKDYVRNVVALPALERARFYTGKCFIVTGASREAVADVALQVGWLPPLLAWEQTLESRTELALALSRRYRVAVYDDRYDNLLGVHLGQERANSVELWLCFKAREPERFRPTTYDTQRTTT